LIADGLTNKEIASSLGRPEAGIKISDTSNAEKKNGRGY